MANTQAAMPTSTGIPEPTATFTLEPSPTNIIIPSPTPDLRVIVIDSREFLLEADYLPANAKYYLSDDDPISPLLNSEVISGWGKEEGLEYLEKTSRMDGWRAAYKRGSISVRAPELITHEIIQCETSEGAYLIVTEYTTVLPGPYALLDDDFPLGDKSNLYKYRFMPSGADEYRVVYFIETVYRNYVSVVMGYGWEKEYDLDYVTMVAGLMVDKLSEAPLGDW